MDKQNRWIYYYPSWFEVSAVRKAGIFEIETEEKKWHTLRARGISGSVASVEVGMNSHKRLATKSRAVANLFRGRPGRRPICINFYVTHKQYIWTAWSRMNLEAAKGSAAITWTCKHVALFRYAPGLSRKHFLSHDVCIEPPDPLNLIARMLSAMSRRAETYFSELKRSSGILSIHFGEHFSENQCRYSP